MNQFHFLRPDWFWLLLPLALFLFWLWRQQLHSRSWQAVCDPQLLPFLLLGHSQRRRNWPLHLVLLALLLAVIALAGPTWERLPQPLFRQHSALVLLLDLSASMSAADLKPNRLVRAQLKIAEILRQRREGQTALVVFAGDAFTVTPLTDDGKTIAALLDSLEPGLMPTLGSRPELAIKQGRRLLQQAGLAKGDLLLITDDDQPEAAVPEATQLHQEGYRLSVLGVGTEAGAPIPMPDGGFFKDAAGQVVLPRLNPAALQQLAQAGGGDYQTIRVDDQDFQALLAGSLRERLETKQQSDQLGDQWREMGVWLLWPLVLLAACAFRRGWLTVVILCGLLAQPVQAFDWQQLWQRPDQQGAQTFAEEDYATAAQQFEDKRWQASAHYRNGQYAEAAKLLEQPEDADDWYNQGNALARSGRLAEALTAYNEALKLNPQDQDALTNKQLVEDAIEQQQQPSPQDGDSSPQDGESSPKDGDSSPQEQSTPAPTTEEQQSSQGSDESSPTEQVQKDAESAASESKEPESQEAEAQSSAEVEEAKDSEGQESTAQAKGPNDRPLSEEERASQQWLQRIPDDPGGLLRRKFLYQYRQREGRQTSDKSW